MPAFPRSGDSFGRYTILEELGRGGMGVVLRAQQVDLGREVALKLLNPEIAEDADFRQRFQREVATLAALDSPHIIQVYDAGIHGEVPYLATQLVSGDDLATRLRTSGPLAVDDALSVMSDVASALSDAHGAGVLHRDIKPANVLLRFTGLFAYLCDFGIARPLSSPQTRTSSVAGTIAYLAPECHAGANASVASDIYSLGCCLWATLTGQAPYAGQTEYQLASAHLNAPVPQLAATDVTGRALDGILRRCLAKRPEDRYSSAQQVEAALREAKAGAGHAGTTILRPFNESDQTALRTPTQAGSDTRPAWHKTRGRRLALLLVVGLAAAAAVGGGVALAAQGDSPSSRPTSSPARTPTPAAPAASPTTAVTTGAVTTHEHARCGDGDAHRGPTACARIFEELSHVFGSLDGRCFLAETNHDTEEVSSVDCDYPGVVVRYSRWVADRDSREGGPLSRHLYFKTHYGGNGEPWMLGGRDTGYQWTERNDGMDPHLMFVWTADYRSRPYSVIVKSSSRTSRDLWRDKVVRGAASTSEIPRA